MKPYISLTIVFAGFVTAIGAGSIVTAEYHIAKSGRDVVASIFAPRAERPITISYDGDSIDSDVAAKLDFEMDQNRLQSLSNVSAPVVDIQMHEASVQKACAAREQRADRERSRADRAHQVASMHSIPSAPKMSEATPMIASYSYSLPTPATKTKIPRGFTFFAKNGSFPKGFHIAPMTFRGPKGEAVQMVFDTKKLEAEQKQFVMQMKSTEAVWNQLSAADLKQMKMAGVMISRSADGKIGEIRIDPSKAACEATQAGLESLKGLDTGSWDDDATPTPETITDSK